MLLTDEWVLYLDSMYMCVCVGVHFTLCQDKERKYLTFDFFKSERVGCLM